MASKQGAGTGDAGDGARVGGPGGAAAHVLLAASASIVVGLVCDISWDGSVGLDTFWSPPHLAINSGALVAWCAALWLLASATRRASPAAVALGPVRAPLGAALVLWGGLAMLSSGVLELWWSRAYGLFPADWTPPHLLTTLGAAAILAGALLVASSRRNAAEPPAGPGAGARAGAAPWPVLVAAALLLTYATTVTSAYNVPNLQHTAWFYLISCPLYAWLLTWSAGAARTRWAAVSTAALYTGVVWLLVLVLPLVPARPRLGPVYQPVDHMLPPQFPLLLLLPAAAVDLLARRVRQRDWLLAGGVGAAFVLLLLCAQWPFSAFLLSPAADNRLFAGGGRHWPFNFQIGARRTEFWALDRSPLTAGAVLLCAALGVAGARVGLWLGRWTGGLRR